MKKIRLVLLAALVFAVTMIIVLYKIPSNGWMVWTAMVITGSFALSVTALFLATLFRTNGNDLWDTGYFKYMRAFWGEIWGGHGEKWAGPTSKWVKSPLQISTCRATWLSVITLLLWSLLVGLCGYLIYFFIAGTILGFEQVSTFWDADSTIAKNIVSHLFVFGLWGSTGLLGLLAIVGLRGSFKQQLPKFHQAAGRALIIYVSIIILFTFVIVPIKYAGLGGYLRGAGLVLLIGIATVYLPWLLFTRVIPRLKEFFEKETVPGALVSAQHKGWKSKVCPLIVQESPAKRDGER